MAKMNKSQVYLTFIHFARLGHKGAPRRAIGAARRAIEAPKRAIEAPRRANEAPRRVMVATTKLTANGEFHRVPGGQFPQWAKTTVPEMTENREFHRVPGGPLPGEPGYKGAQKNLFFCKMELSSRKWRLRASMWSVGIMG